MCKTDSDRPRLVNLCEIGNNLRKIVCKTATVQTHHTPNNILLVFQVAANTITYTNEKMSFYFC